MDSCGSLITCARTFNLSGLCPSCAALNERAKTEVTPRSRWRFSPEGKRGPVTATIVAFISECGAGFLRFDHDGCDPNQLVPTTGIAVLKFYERIEDAPNSR